MNGISSTLGGRWWLKALGLLLVPVVVAAGLLAATWHSDTRLSKVQAAIVNLDKAVTLNGKTVPLGRQLSAQLISAQQGQNFTWVLADAAHASDGLRSGRYAAVVTIPENFSAAATSYAGTASSAEQATIDVATSPVAGIADTAVGQSVAQAAALALNQTLTEGYLDQVYLGFNTTGQQFQTVADAAKKLADGSSELSNGLAQAAPGARQLSEGLYRITSNGALIRAGGSSLVSGITQYTSGAEQAATGAAQLSSGLSQLSAGSAQLRSGVSALDAGIATYRTQGLVPYTQGVTQLLTPLGGEVDLLTGIRQLTDQALAGGSASSYAANAGAAAATLAGTTAALQGSATAAAGLATTLDARTASAVDSATSVLSCPVSVGAPGSPACEGYAAGVRAAAQAAASAASAQINATSGGRTLDQLATSISSDATTLSATAPKLQTVVAVTTPLVVVASNIPSTDLLAQQKAAAAALAPAGAGVVAGLDAVRAGVSESLGGQASLQYGINAYTSGVDQGAAGAQQLSSGLGQLSSGGGALRIGAQQYTSGVNQVLDGIEQAAPGASQLADGIQKSADGGSQLADGTKQLADGLAKGASQVPSYTTQDRTQLAKVVASPISVSGLDGLVQPGAALAALLMALALWVGAFATYTVLPAVRRRLALSSRSSAALVVDALQPGLVIVLLQALLVSAVGEAFVRLPPYRWLQLTLLLLVAGVAFVAVNHALSAWTKGAGRLVAVAFAVVTVATALTSSVPGWLDALRPLSPLSPAHDAVRAVVSGGPGVTGGVFALIAWTLLGALFSVAAILRARTVSPAALAAVA
jgi:putative membrane protein